MSKLFIYCLTSLALLTSSVWAENSSPIKFRRICKDGPNNTLFWYSVTDNCPILKYIIHGRNGTTGPFTYIDTVFNASIETRTHINANPSTTTKTWYYYIETIDTCGSIHSILSDTVSVDLSPTSPTYFDSVSVDPLTNRIYLGWFNNLTPDFSVFQVLRKDGSTYVYLNEPGSRDTFFIDNASNPSTSPISYDITTKDSCNIQDTLGINPHTTIFLDYKTDTCKRTIDLKWTPYQGWLAVRSYHIYKSINSGPFVCLDSVNGNILNYSQTITLGDNLRYFVRAIKNDSRHVTSSSNLISFTTRKRIDPSTTYLKNISSKLTENLIQISVTKKPQEEILKFGVQRSTDGGFSEIQTIQVLDQQAEEYYTEDAAPTQERFLYKVIAFNLCSEPSHETNISNNIVLAVSNNGSENMLVWNKYFSWDSGVEKYIIFRGTGESIKSISFSRIDSVLSLDSTYTDLRLPDRVGNTGLCYYIIGIQNAGSASGESSASYSNIACNAGELRIYIPNAFTPSGSNTHFRPEGSFIDYDRSSMQVYDRWGSLVIELPDLITGWNGVDISGRDAAMGVYFYKIKIKSVDGQNEIKTGSVTLLR